MDYAFKHQLRCALFVPVPPPPYTGPSSAWQMESYWQRVWRRAAHHKDNPNFAIYFPQQQEGVRPHSMPPFFSRYFLLLEPNAPDFDRSLYLTVETQENKQMELIATKDAAGQYSVITDWEQYFGSVLEEWMKDKEKKLPSGECGYWKRWRKIRGRQRARPECRMPAANPRVCITCVNTAILARGAF